ncbi:MAG: hypothetical protein HQK89_05610 [Nitrospirae bacterium]|nr:hypothetical protein [Nitrospirota bacterium]
MSDDLLKNLMNLYSNPLFKNAFKDYFTRMQEEGMEAARKAFNLSPEKNNFMLGANAFEKMIEFYSDLGFVSRKKYDELLKENDDLRKENAFLKDTMHRMNVEVFTDGSKSMQEAWKNTLEKQTEMSKELTKSFFDFFKGMSKK